MDTAGSCAMSWRQPTAIVEEKDATQEQREITEVNASFYCVGRRFYWNALNEVKPANAQGEYYHHRLHWPAEYEGSAQRRAYIAIWRNVRRQRQVTSCHGGHLNLFANGRRMKDNGITMIDPPPHTLTRTVEVGLDTVIYPGVIRRERQRSAGCTLYPGSRIRDSTLETARRCKNSVVQEAEIGEHSTVGPNAYVRPGSHIGDGCRVGDFVEMKNSTIGDGTKGIASYLYRGFRFWQRDQCGLRRCGRKL